jgi:hypothetical protein
MAEATTWCRVWPVSGSANASCAASQLNLKLLECAESQICRTGEFGLTTNLAFGSSNSIERAPELKSGSKPYWSAAAESFR